MSPQSPNSKTTENEQRSTGRKKRLSQIMPELRERIPGLFDRDVPAERLAEQFSINKTEILEELIRDTRRAILGKGPQSQGLRAVNGQRLTVMGMRRVA